MVKEKKNNELWGLKWKTTIHTDNSSYCHTWDAIWPSVFSRVQPYESCNQSSPLDNKKKHHRKKERIEEWLRQGKKDHTNTKKSQHTQRIKKEEKQHRPLHLQAAVRLSRRQWNFPFSTKTEIGF